MAIRQIVLMVWRQLLSETLDELEQHMLKEEEVLFPMISP
jgi:iron-sulfur cluster repair protein YtfE (RIC family)